MNEAAHNASSLAVLNEQREETVALINAHKETLAEIEKDILEHPDLPPLKDKGVTHCGPVKITTGWNRKWNQLDLTNLYWRLQEEMVDLTFWPFKTEFKEVAATMEALKKGFPDVAKRIEDVALSVSPKKPSIATVEEKT